MQLHRCWRCGEERPAKLLCDGCGAVLPPRDEASYFTLMGFPDHPAIDVKALESRYFELSRALHPDRHHGGDSRQHSASVRAAALLNQAYRTLRDLEGRGRYWLRRQGEELGRDNSKVPVALAEMAFETQDLLAQLRHAAPEDRAALHEKVARAHAQIDAKVRSERGRLDELLRTWPAAEEGRASQGPAALVQQLKEVLSELSYLRTLDRETRARLED